MTHCFWSDMLFLPHREFMLLTTEQKPMKVIHNDCLSYGGNELAIKNKPRKYSKLLEFCLCHQRSHTQTTRWIFQNVSTICPCMIHSDFVANPGQKTQTINFWRNSPPISTVIRQSVGKTSPLAHKPQFLYGLLSISAQEAFSRFWDANEPYELRAGCYLNTAAFQVDGKTCIILNVMCLYLPCWLIPPQLLTLQKSREAF